jgi:hypothetical protein
MEVQSNNTPLYRKQCACAIQDPSRTAPYKNRSVAHKIDLVLCPAQELVFEQGGIFIVSHLLWHGASVFPVSSKVLPHQSSVSYVWRTYCYQDIYGHHIQCVFVIMLHNSSVADSARGHVLRTYSNPDPHG